MNECVHEENNHMKGTEFDCEPTTEDSPIRRGVVTIDGVRLRLAVFPAKKSKSGNEYYPIRLRYMEDSRFVLRAEPVGNLGVMW